MEPKQATEHSIPHQTSLLSRIELDLLRQGALGRSRTNKVL